MGNPPVQSSHHHPQSNGHAKQAVKQIKDLLKKTSGQDLDRAIMELRNTLRVSDGLSPAQWYLGHRQRTSLPAQREQYQRLDDETIAAHASKRQREAEKVKERGPRNAEQRFKTKDHVVIQNPVSKEWNLHGTITKRLSPRRYKIKTKSGRLYDRNGQYLWPSAQTTGQEATAQPNPTTSTSHQQNSSQTTLTT